MSPTPCAHCGGPVRDRRHGRIPRYCSTRCRVAAHRARRRAVARTADPVPAELRDRDRWVRWSPTKRPLTTTGAAASVTSPATWSTYATAVASTAGVGVGLVLNGDGLVCIDLDHCLTSTGDVQPWARDLVDRLPATYIEVSPSRDGLHVWGYGHVPHGRRLTVPGGTVEVYGTGRYITVTGRPWRGAPSRLADLSAVLADLL